MLSDSFARKAVTALALAVVSCGEPSAPDQSTDSGCGKLNPMQGDRQVSIAGFDGLYYVRLPSSYDANKPYPLGFAFHGANRNHYQCYSEDCWGFQTALGAEAVLVYMQSLRPPDSAGEEGWDFERENNVAFFETVLETAKSDYCIDESRVFVAGTSSGAIFSNLLACRHGDQLLATAPVAGSLLETESCRGTPAALLIHGIDDPHVPFAEGEAARDFFAAQNGCSARTEPELATVHADIRAKRDAMPTVEDIGCVDYQECATPVRWCEHSFGGYDLSTHGWPAPAGDLIGEFVRNLP